MKIKSMFVAAAMALSASSANAAIQVFTDFTSWFNAVSAVSTFITTETFTGNVLTAPGLTVTSTAGTITGNFFSDRVTADDGESTTFTFGSLQNAVGGFFDLTPAGAGQGLTLTLLGAPDVVVGTEVANSSGPGSFFGILSDAAFGGVKITAGTQAGSAETFHLDNLSFAASAVPELDTWLMMLVGFAGIGFVARRRALTA